MKKSQKVLYDDYFSMAGTDFAYCKHAPGSFLIVGMLMR